MPGSGTNTASRSRATPSNRPVPSRVQVGTIVMSVAGQRPTFNPEGAAQIAQAAGFGIGTTPMLSNCILAFGEMGEAISCEVGSWAALDCCDLFGACLKYALSDSRVHVPNVGMRWPQEVDANVKLVDEFEPPFDVAGLPRGTNKVYDAQDAETAQ